MPTKALPLYVVEDDLRALIDSQDLVSPEMRSEFAAALAAKDEQAIAKRDDCIRAVAALEAQAEFDKKEEERIYEHRKSIEAGLDRLKAYLVGVVERFGTQKDGQKTKTLPARIGVLRAFPNAGKVLIEDESQIPLRFKRATVVFDSAEDWDWFHDLWEKLDGGPRRESFRISLEPMKERIADAFEAKEDVPGADWQFGDCHLRLK